MKGKKTGRLLQEAIAGRQRSRIRPILSLLLRGLCLLLLAASVLMSGCSLKGSGTKDPAPGHKGPRGTKPYTIKGKTYYPLLSAHGFREEGVASWYGKDFHGKQTANGERYNMHGMTAAHKLLPFGTKVKVTNKRNNKSIIVRINDRGPFASNRVIDLTRTGAQKLDMIKHGTAPVLLETVGTVPGLKDGVLKGHFYVQVGAFGNEANARNLVATLQRQGYGGRTCYSDDLGFGRGQAGPYESLNTAETAADRLRPRYPSSFPVAE
mgnify:FL=1